MKARASAAVCGITFALTLAGIAGGWAAGYRLNITESVPMGVYRVTSTPAGRGDLVEFCPDPASPAVQLAIQRAYLPSGPCPGDVSRLLKPVVGLPGDRIEATPEGVTVNGALMVGSLAHARDGRGRPMPQPPQTYVVPSGHVVVLTTNPVSFDSRYFGPIEASRLSGSVQAISRF